MREVIDAVKGVSEFTSLLDGALDLPSGTSNTVLLLAGISGSLKFGRVLSVWSAMKIFHAARYFVTSVREAFRNEVHPAAARILAHLDDEKATYILSGGHFILVTSSGIKVELDKDEKYVRMVWLAKNDGSEISNLWHDFTRAEQDLITAKVRKRVAWVKERDRQIRLAGVPLVPADDAKPFLSVYDPNTLAQYAANYVPVLGRSASVDKDGNCTGR